MTEILVTAKINDGKTGELIEKVEFIYCVEQTVENDDDLTTNDRERIQAKIENLREYETTDTDIYRVDGVILNDGEKEE